jgi:predicted O-linked N-acetylglucosamine transferase (SPINDLY family)
MSRNLELEKTLQTMAAWSLQEVLGKCDALSKAGQLMPAIGLYQLWLKGNSHPLAYIAWFNLSTLLGQIKQYAQAEVACRRALEINSDLHQARLNLGHHLENQARVAEAWVVWKDAEARLQAPISDEQEDLLIHALNNLARSLEVARRYDEAEAYLIKSLKVNSDQSSVLSHYVHLRQKQCKWPVYQPPTADITVNQMMMATSALAALAATDDPAMQLLAAREFVHSKLEKPVKRKRRNPKRRGEKIKIGYLSGDLCMHAVGLLTVELFELHNRERFEVFGFCWSKEDASPLRARIVKAFDHLIKIGNLDDLEAAKVIESHDVDVLIDLQGLTNGARPNILMHRPAGAIQISYLGLPGTSALPTVDYILADPYVYPSELMPYMTEKPLYVPNCYQVSDRKREVGPPLSRAQCGLPDNHFVYAAFNNNYKITPEVFACWMQILKKVPNSVLWLMADNSWSEENMRSAAFMHGVDSQRLIFAGRAQPPEYMARLALPDLFLDTFPYNAGTTANDILWMGTPILTRSGRSYISRMCGSLLCAAQLSELIADDEVDYVRRAVRIGIEGGVRGGNFRRKLRESPLFDMDSLVCDIENAIISIVEPWSAGVCLNG